MPRTVLGEIPANQMGNTSVHEHLITAEYFHTFLDKLVPHEFSQEECDFAIAELQLAKDAGLDTLVEVSAMADPRQLKYIAERSPVNIITSTGFYKNFSKEQQEFTAEQFRDHIVYENEKGLRGSGVMPGVIKIATFMPKLHPWEVRALFGAGMAQKITGLPMCIHSATGTRYQQYIIEAAGANMEKVYFSHMESPTDREGRTVDMQVDYIIDTMEKGSYVSFNGFVAPEYLSPEAIGELVTKVVKRGYSHMLMLSLDHGLGWKRDLTKTIADAQGVNANRRTFASLMTDVVPWLGEIGIADKDIKNMISLNAQKLFE